MSKLAKLAGVVPFAHLLGIRAESENTEEDEHKKEEQAKRADWAKKAESDDERKQKEGESDEDYATRMEELDEEEEKEKAKAEDDEADAKAEEKEGGCSEEAKAERSRCAKIMAHGIKHGIAAQAGVFAFNTQMSVSASIAALNASASLAPQKRAGLSDRMSGVTIPKVKADAPASHDPNDPNASAKTLADSIIAAAAKARGEKT